MLCTENSTFSFNSALFMLQFFKYVLATLTGLVLFSILSLALLVGIGSVFSSTEILETKQNSVLKLDLNKPISEVSVENPFAEIGGPFSGEEEVTGLKDIRDALLNAAKDKNIQGVYLRTENPSAGWATLEEIRNALLVFKKSKKFIYTYGEAYSEKGYYVASVADHIFLNPAGDLEWNGLSTEYQFLKGTFEKLEIEPQIFRVGEFKSAIEMFSRKDMSEASRKQSKELIEAIYTTFVNNIASSRNVPATRLRELADSLSISNANSALTNKLVTDLGYADQVETSLKKQLKLDEKDKIEFVGLSQYLKAPGQEKEGDFNKRIAVIVAEGEIVSGTERNGVIASDKFLSEMKKARENDKIKAIVLRINSPGGSSLASDVMWREIQLTTKKKPVIASMSDVAASGGYYMAMGCDTIVAQPNTITGSIGIFALLFNVEHFMDNKLGITFDRVKTAEHADWPSGTREMSDFEKNRIQKMVNEGYETFTSKAAAGRKMPIDKLKSLAQGRVWSGIEAKENGLVDVLGGLDDAVRIAAKAAKLKEGDYRVRFYPEKKNTVDELLNKLMGQEEEKTLAKQLGQMAPYLTMIQKINRLQGLQARLPFEMTIR